MLKIEIYWDDLTSEKQKEILDILGDNGNYDVTPIATIDVEEELDWDKAIHYLTMLIAAYVEIGPAGAFGYHMVLRPLKERYDKGERTSELYNAIMECE